MGEHRNGVTGGPELSAIDSPDNTRTDDEDLHFRRCTSAGPPMVAIAFRRSGAQRGRCACAAFSTLRRIVMADGGSVAARRRSFWATVLLLNKRLVIGCPPSSSPALLIAAGVLGTS